MYLRGESAETLTVKAVSAADPGKSDTAEVTLTKPVQGIVITTPPGKTIYSQGEELNLAGLTVTVTFTGNTKETVAAGNLAVSGYDKNKPGTQTVTVMAADTGAYPVVMEGQGYDTLEEAVGAAAGTTAAITLMSDITVSSGITVSASNTNITLTGSGTERVVSSGDPEFRFILEGSGVSLTLDTGVTLKWFGVSVKSGTALVLKTGAKITDNSTGNEVFVQRDGTFTMQGGESSGNTAHNGGGVYNEGTFTMRNSSAGGNDSLITYNYAESSSNSVQGDKDYKCYIYGGGVYVAANGTFIMQGGSLLKNTLDADILRMNQHSYSDYVYVKGGGVYNAGTFTMQAGEITDSTLSVVLDRHNLFSYNKYAYGGGVYLDSGSAITKTRGTINAGSLSSTGDKGGAAVYVDCTGNPVRLENDVEADHRLTKAAADTAESSLTPDNGWTK